MKFTFEGTEGWTEKPELFGEIALKMYAIRDNIRFIYEALAEQYPNTEILKEVGVNNLIFNTTNIVVDLRSASDEFYLEHENGTSYVYMEVVTEQIAEENDRELLDYYSKNSGEDKADYQLGGTLSDYTKLGETNYYFKFM